MPELPEVETVVRSLRPHLVGARIAAVNATVKQLRTPVRLQDLRQCCRGATIQGLRRRAKFIIVQLDGDRQLLLHLGMTGAFRITPAEAPVGDYDRIIWDLEDGRSWRFVDIRRFGSVQICVNTSPRKDPPVLEHLGPEPLSDAFNGKYLYQTTRGRKRPIKNLIMDQRIVVGVGNIYANEALFRAGVTPKRQSRRIGRKTADRIVDCIKTVLREAIRVGGTTISDFRDVDGSEGTFRIHLRVYGRDATDCPRCGMPAGIRREVMAGRSSFFCPRCQR